MKINSISISNFYILIIKTKTKQKTTTTNKQTNRQTKETNKQKQNNSKYSTFGRCYTSGLLEVAYYDDQMKLTQL